MCSILSRTHRKNRSFHLKIWKLYHIVLFYFSFVYNSPMAVTQKQVKEALENVLDPELGISIVDLGLIYDISVKQRKAHITMTLTTLGCPLFHVIESDIKNTITALGIPSDNIEIELVFDPPWNMDMMSEHAKAVIGI